MSTDEEFKAATLAFAKYIGIDLDGEPELVRIARKALQSLPPGWEVCISDEDESNESVWNHPDEDKYIRMVREERKYLEQDRADRKKGEGSSKNKDRDYHDGEDDGYYDNKKRDKRSNRSNHDDARHNDDYFDEYGSSATPMKNKNYDDYDDYDRGRDNAKNKDRHQDNDRGDRYSDRHDGGSKGKTQTRYDDYDYDDDYDPDAELAKLNTSWGGDKFEKKKNIPSDRDRKTADDDGEAVNEVMDLDVEEFNNEELDDSQAFDFMPQSAKHVKQSNISANNAVKQEGTESRDRNRSSGNAIFGDHWLDEEDPEKDKNSQPRNESKTTSQGDSRPLSRGLEGGDGRDNFVTEDKYSKTAHETGGKDRNRQSRDESSRSPVQKGEWGRDVDRSSGNDRDKRDDNLRNNTSRDLHSENRRSGSGRGGGQDNWGMERGRDRLEEERTAVNSNHWGTSGVRSAKDNRSSWGESPTKGLQGTNVRSSREVDSGRDDWKPARNSYDELYEPKISESPSKFKATVDSHSGSLDRRRDRERDFPVTESSHIHAGVNETLREEVSRLQQQLEDLRVQHSGDIRELDITTQSLRSSLQISEVSLQSERTLRSKAESSTRDAQLENEKLRLQIQNMMLTPSAEFEALKRAEIENATIRVTDEWSKKLKALELKHEKEIDAEQRTISSMRHDVSVLEDNIRDLEKQLRHIRDETSQKEKHSREASSAKTIDLESNIRSLETELSRVKEEYASMAARAASALQQAKVAKAEADSLRAETSSIVSDGHTSHAALMQALQRIQQLETELVRAKTEKEVLQQDMDKQYSELRKYQDVSISKDGKTQLTEMELKRSKAHFESEMSRTKSRIAELEANNMILQSQLDKASETEIASNRELQRRIDRGEHEVIRLQEKGRESDEKLRESQVRVASLEREVLSFQDTIFRKDRSLREVNAKLDTLVGQREQLREAMESELDGLQAEVKAEKEHNKSLVRAHQKEMEELKLDVENRIPSIVSGVTNHAESHFNEQLQNEIAAVKVRYTHQLNALKHEIVEMQSAHQEAVVRLKSRASNESIEMDSLRQKCQQFEDKNRDLAATIETLAFQSKHTRLLNLGGSNTGGRYSMAMPQNLMDTSILNMSSTTAYPQGVGLVREDVDASREDNKSVHQHLQPPPDALNSIAAQLINMRTQLNQSMESRTSHLKSSNDAGAFNRQKVYFDGGDDDDDDDYISSAHVGRHAAGNTNNEKQAKFPTGVPPAGKENAAPLRQSDTTNVNTSSRIAHRERPFTSSRNTYISTDDSPMMKYDYTDHNSSVLATPSRSIKGKSKYDESPEALFDSPLHNGKVRVDDSTMNESDYFMQHDWHSGTESDLLVEPSIHTSKLTSDFSSIQDGGYHEGYWKAKYLRK